MAKFTSFGEFLRFSSKTLISSRKGDFTEYFFPKILCLMNMHGKFFHFHQYDSFIPESYVHSIGNPFKNYLSMCFIRRFCKFEFGRFILKLQIVLHFFYCSRWCSLFQTYKMFTHLYPLMLLFNFLRLDLQNNNLFLFSYLRWNFYLFFQELKTDSKFNGMVEITVSSAPRSVVGKHPNYVSG